MPCRTLALWIGCQFVLAFFLHAEKNLFPESPDLPPLLQGGLFGTLAKGDDRDAAIRKLEDSGYLGYRELHSNLIKSPVRWDGHAYELTCKFDLGGGLELCLVQGEAGWQDFFFEDVVRPQWLSLRERVIRSYGKPGESLDFPEYFDIPLNDRGGYVTDSWDLSDRIILLSLQTYSEQDCCTRQVLDFSCCILLIKPK